jgi:hypothetical protein
VKKIAAVALGVLLAAGWATASTSSAAQASAASNPGSFPPGLTVSDGVLYRAGHPYRGIGVNYFAVFYSHLLDPSDTSYQEGLADLGAHHIPFARFMATGFGPNDVRLYVTNPGLYWKLMSDVVTEAEKDQVGLIPDFFWLFRAVPNLVSESVDKWGNPTSKTRVFMRQYVADFILRFANSPAIWGYEFGNEYNNEADVPGFSLTSTAFVSAVTDFANTVRLYDPYRIIESGNFANRLTAWHQKYAGTNQVNDNLAEYAQMMEYLNPPPLDMMSVHYYPQYNDGTVQPLFQTDAQYLNYLNALANQNKQPLFIGEFGISDTNGVPTESTVQQFIVLLGEIVQSGTPLAAMWVYDFPLALDPRVGSDQLVWNARYDNQRAYQLWVIELANVVESRNSTTS